MRRYSLHEVAIDEEHAKLLEQIMRRYGYTSRSAAIAWLIRAQADHDARIERENKREGQKRT